MKTFKQFMEDEERKLVVQGVLVEDMQDKLRRLLSQIASATTAAGVVSLSQSAGIDLDQLDQMGIGIGEIMEFLKRARLTVDQFKILSSLRDDLKLRLRDQCFSDLSKFKGTTRWLDEKGKSIDACKKYCDMTKDEKACSKSGSTVYNFGRYKRVARNPFARRY
jgi:hypothetical protein